MARNFIVRDVDGKLQYDNLVVLKPEALKAIDHSIRIRILKLLSKEAMYPIQIAKALKMHEQKVYYHVKKLLEAEAIEIIERKEIRGTTAKKFRPKDLNFAISLEFNGKDIKNLDEETRDKKLEEFLYPFVDKGKLNTKIVVGSPDPHGPHKARARDGHYAIDLAVFLGSFATISNQFVTQLDVDTDLDKKKNLIVVGGPVTNLTMARLNDSLPAKFSDKKPWGIQGKESYTDDNIGLIAKLKLNGNSVLVVAGIRYGGTKAAVLALTRHTKLVLSRFTGQKNFYTIVQGFDMDGDGKVDSVEQLE